MHTFLKKFLFLWILFFSTSLFADSILQKNITISDASAVYEYDASLQFAISLSSAPFWGTSVTVHYKTINNGSATAGSDYTYTEGDVTFSSGDPTTKVISVPVLNDTIHESTEHVSVEITEDSMFYEVTDGRGEGTIYDDDLAPLKLTTFNDKGVTETDTDQTLYLVAYFNQNLPSDVTVTYHTVDKTAHAGSDYVGVSGGTVTASAGNNRVLLPVTIKGDTSPESTEDFKVIIDSISSGTIEDSQATATIDDDDTIEVYVDCDDADEGNAGESNNVACHIYLAKPYPAGEPNLVIDYNSQDGSSPSAIAGEDYSSVSGHVTFTTGDTEKIVNIPTIGDDVVEDDENVKMVISGSSSIIKSASEPEILNDDGNFPSVDFSTADVSVVEGNSSTKTLNFHCKLDADAIADSYFDYYTQDDTAQSGDNDYEAISTTRYNIPVGTRDINIQVTVNGDTKVEKDELFYLKVKNEHHIVVSGHKAKGTIINDDGILAIVNFDKYHYDIVEGNSSTKTLNFTLSLDNPALAGSSFDYYTYDGSAKLADSDYVKVEDTKHIFSGGETNVTIPVTINGDTNIEDDEHFYLHVYNEVNLTFSGTQTARGDILNDDGSYPKLDIENPSYSTYEGNSSTHTIDIKVVLDKPALKNTSVEYYTYDRTAQDGSTSTEDTDYIATTGTLNIPKGNTSATFQVTINGDTNIEPKEMFIVALKNPKNVTLGRRSSGVYILNDDEHNEEPFVCDEHMYLSSSKKRGSEDTGRMWLHRIDTTTSPFRFEVMDDEGEANLYNAIGYNPEDNYIYGLYYRNLIKISKTGKIIDLGKVNALPATFDNYQLFAGAVYDSEHYYVAGMGIDTNTMYIINLNDKSVTEKTLSESINIKDFSLSPDGSLLYGIIDGGQFVKIDTTTGIVTKVGEAHSGEFDSTFSDKNGRFFANDSQGSGFYEFNIHTGAKSFLSDSQPATFNDGTNCLNAELLFTDYGDAPISYGPAWHNIANGVYLGDKVDHDIDSYDTVNADGDDLNGVDDDDGVALVDGTDINGTYFETNATHQIKVKLSKEAYLKIWIDKGIDGHFDDSTDLIYSSGSKLSAGEHTITFSLEDGLRRNTTTYLRARVSSSASMNPTGFMSDGEVEDYAIYFGRKFTPPLGSCEGVFPGAVSSTNDEIQINVNTKIYGTTDHTLITKLLAISNPVTCDDAPCRKSNTLAKTMNFNLTLGQGSDGDKILTDNSTLTISSDKEYKKFQTGQNNTITINGDLTIKSQSDFYINAGSTININGDVTIYADKFDSNQEGIFNINGSLTIVCNILYLNSGNNLQNISKPENFVVFAKDIIDINSQVDFKGIFYSGGDIQINNDTIITGALTGNYIDINDRATINYDNGAVNAYCGNSLFTPLQGKFNIERTDSVSSTINSDERNAWYTQIVGRDFDYSLVFYKDDFSAEKNISDVTVQVDLMDMDTNTSLYQNRFYIDSQSSIIRKSITLPDDLNNLPATKNARFKVKYGVDSSGNIVQGNCMHYPSLCTDYREDYAKDNFAIRPEKFYVSIADGTKQRVNSISPNPISFVSGYDYNLSAKAIKYFKNYPDYNASEGYNGTVTRNLHFISNGSCLNSSDQDKNITFSNGKYRNGNFSNPYVGKYKLNILKDSSWTSVDQNGRDCIDNNSSTSSNPNEPSGCNISQIDNIDIEFQPDHFAVNLNLGVLPNSGHQDFIYMSELNSTYSDVAVQFSGEVVAQNKDNQTTKNFTNGCVAKSVLLDLNATTLSVEGTNKQIKTISGTAVNFSRYIIYNSNSNNSTSEITSSLVDLNGSIVITPNKFLDENNGTVELDMRYNLNKHLTEPINPVAVTFNSIEVNSTNANSSAYQIENYTPSGAKTFPNNVKNFYFARVVSDFDNYPRVNMNVSPIVRTPLNVDIYCKTNIANYCKDRGVIINSNVTATTREAYGWYLSINHNASLDGNVTNLTANPPIVTITPDSDPSPAINEIMLPNGTNGMVIEKFQNCSSPSSTITIKTSPALAFEPSKYVVNCTDINASQWTGVGKTGNVLEVKPKVNRSMKMEW